MNGCDSVVYKVGARLLTERGDDWLVSSCKQTQIGDTDCMQPQGDETCANGCEQIGNSGGKFGLRGLTTGRKWENWEKQSQKSF